MSFVYILHIGSKMKKLLDVLEGADNGLSRTARICWMLGFMVVMPASFVFGYEMFEVIHPLFK